MALASLCMTLTYASRFSLTCQTFQLHPWCLEMKSTKAFPRKKLNYWLGQEFSPPFNGRSWTGIIGFIIFPLPRYLGCRNSGIFTSAYWTARTMSLFVLPANLGQLTDALGEKRARLLDLFGLLTISIQEVEFQWIKLSRPNQV